MDTRSFEEAYFDWLNQPGVKEEILKGLDQIAEHGPLNNMGVCGNLNKILGHPSFPNAYDFVSCHSEEYREFYRYAYPLLVGDKWAGKAGEFRREWCRKTAAALRADPMLWNKVWVG